MERELNLTDILPPSSSFRLKATGDMDFRVRPWNIQDEAWIQKKYKKNIAQLIAIDNPDLEALGRVIFRLILAEDKAIFKKQEITDIDEEGNEVTESLGGYQLLMATIRDGDDVTNVLNAISKTYNESQPEANSSTSTAGGGPGK